MAGMRIVSVGHAHGETVVTNDDMKKYVDTSDEWIKSKTGIERRYFANNQTNVDMAAKAAKAAMNKDVKHSEIDALIVATFTPDNATPPAAAEVAGRLGIEGNVLTFDLNGACSGFVYGCIVANALLQSGYRKILMIGSEKIHPMVDMLDRRTCVLFGDAAGAVIFERDDNGLFYHHEGVLPDYDILHCNRFNPAIRMAGQEVYRFAVSKVPECADRLLNAAKLGVDDVDMFIFHQANKRIIDSAARKMKISDEKYFVNVEKYGNTSAASIAVAISEATEQGKLKNGDTMVAIGFGGGLTFGGVLMTI